MATRPDLYAAMREAEALALSAGWNVKSRAATGSVYLVRAGWRAIRISDHARSQRNKSERKNCVSINVSRLRWREYLAAALADPKAPASRAKAIREK